jgi:hypothetical protein
LCARSFTQENFNSSEVIMPKQAIKKKHTQKHQSVDPFSHSDWPNKIKCNDMVKQIFSPFKGKRVLLLDSEVAYSTHSLLEDGHKPRDLFVVNYFSHVCEQITQKTHKAVNVIHNKLQNFLLTCPGHLKFSALYLDFNGNFQQAVECCKLLFERNLLESDACIAIQWCMRSCKANTFSGEKYQYVYDTEASISQMAEQHNYAIYRLPGNTHYRNMIFWSFRVRSCKFSNSSDHLLMSHLFAHVKPTSEEYEIEKIISKRKHMITKQLQYEVKWKGYEKTTFEPAFMLEEDCPAMLAQFKKKEKLL